MAKEGPLRALITGITGFAGSHLADHLLAQEGWEVTGVGLPRDSRRNVAHLGARITLHLLDMGDYEAVRQLLEGARPGNVYHLAAQAAVGRSWAKPAETLTNNVVAQANLLQGIVELGLHPRVLIVGSGDEYGLVRPEDLPVGEETPLRPLNPYAVSKIAQDYLGYQYYLSRGVDVVRVRPFNHIGPRQGPGFVVPDFSLQLAEIEMGRREPVLRVGNLSAVRDFTDVRDMVRAYYLALLKGQAGEVYNIGSSKGCAIQEILNRLESMCRVSVRVEPDEARLRPSDVPIMVCNSQRFRSETGWAPEYALERSLQGALDDWRDRVAGRRAAQTGDMRMAQ